MVFRLDNAHDIDANNQEDLIDFVDRNFIAELPQFKGEEFQNIHWWDNEHELTEDYKAKALEMVCKHNLHKCAVTVNGGKKIYLIGADAVIVVRKQSMKLTWMS
jgi:hypothetical protein